jgi:ABC-type glycerol-3-phosphate transport system permease component
MGLSARKTVWKLGEGFGNGCNKPREVTALEFTINSKQAIAVIWTLIAFALSLVVVIALGYPFSYGTWQLSIGLFFALLLVMVLPAYLLIALWQILSED